MSLADSLALFQARCAANIPALAVGGTSRAYGYARAFLSACDDISYLVAQAAPSLSVQTAPSLAALSVLAGNYGITPDPGQAATAPSVVFSLPNGTAATTLTIPAGTLISTVSPDGITAPVFYTTQAVATISSGASSSNAVSALATVAGTAGNVTTNTIVVIATQGVAGIYTVTNTAPATGGRDPDTFASLQAKITAANQPKYSAAQLQAQALTVSGIYDAYVSDPQDGTGAFAVYNADVNGVVAAGATLTALQTAIGLVAPPGIKAASITYPAFTVQNITAMALSYSAPAAVQSSVIEPLIQAATKEYIQGNTAKGYSGIIHGQVPTLFGLYAYIQAYVGYQLTSVVYTSSTPTLTGATSANTTLWRLTGAAGSVVTLTRV